MRGGAYLSNRGRQNGVSLRATFDVALIPSLAGKEYAAPCMFVFAALVRRVAAIPGGWPSAGVRTGGTVRPLARTVGELGPSVLALVLNR